MDDSGAPSIIDFDLNGDVLLRVGKADAASAIRVSSGVLSAASKFFASALQDSNIRENKVQRSYDNPREIPMIADDPEVVLSLCNIIYYRRSAVAALKRPALLQLAMLSHKYECLDSVGSWISGELGKQFLAIRDPTTSVRPTAPSDLSIADIVGLAYTFDDAELFWSSSKIFPSVESLGPELRTLLPSRLIGKLGILYGMRLSNLLWQTSYSVRVKKPSSRFTMKWSR